MKKNPYDVQDMSNSIVADLIREERYLILECCSQEIILTHRDIESIGFDEFTTAQGVADGCRHASCGSAHKLIAEVKAHELIEICPTCGQKKLKAEYEDHILSPKGGRALGVDDFRGVPLCQCDHRDHR